MRQVTIGIDPDSDRHGVAIYVDGKLIALESWTLMDIYLYTERQLCRDDVEFHIENVCANNATFHKGGVKNKRAGLTVTRSIGKCQQAQIELERALSLLDVKVVRHTISKNWKSADSGKKALKKYTGWDGRSNEDTRSSAYFGWLGCKMRTGKDGMQ
jgi:hypothetical protein